MTRQMRKLRIPQGRCRVTGKLRYDQNTARGALADARKTGKAYRRECRIYECPDCSGWHLTSHETWEDR